jgi:ribosomal protein S18 acetylase RimI-like enzyme
MWQGFFRALASDEARQALVLTRASVPVGLAVLRRQVMLGYYLELFAIAPGDRRRGAGRVLLQSVENIAFCNSTNLYLCVSDFNTAARAFYESAGYREVGRLDDLVVAGHAEILMRKTTGPAKRAPR